MPTITKQSFNYKRVCTVLFYAFVFFLILSPTTGKSASTFSTDGEQVIIISPDRLQASALKIDQLSPVVHAIGILTRGVSLTFTHMMADLMRTGVFTEENYSDIRPGPANISSRSDQIHIQRLPQDQITKSYRDIFEMIKIPAGNSWFAFHILDLGYPQVSTSSVRPERTPLRNYIGFITFVSGATRKAHARPGRVGSIDIAIHPKESAQMYLIEYINQRPHLVARGYWAVDIPVANWTLLNDEPIRRVNRCGSLFPGN